MSTHYDVTSFDGSLAGGLRRTDAGAWTLDTTNADLRRMWDGLARIGIVVRSGGSDAATLYDGEASTPLAEATAAQVATALAPVWRMNGGDGS